MKVIFDFDDVIFNAKAFKETLFATLKARGYDDVKTKYDVMRKSEDTFSLLSFLRHVTFDSSEEYVMSLYEEIMQRCPNLVNEEVHEVINELGKENCYIVTHGDKDFQLDKIQRSIGLSSVKEIVVVSGSKAEAIKMLCDRHSNEEVIFVDDKLLFINDLPVTECQNLKTVLFNHNGHINLTAEIAESRRVEVKAFNESDNTRNVLIEKTTHNQVFDQQFSLR